MAFAKSLPYSDSSSFGPLPKHVARPDLDPNLTEIITDGEAVFAGFPNVLYFFCFDVHALISMTLTGST